MAVEEEGSGHVRQLRKGGDAGADDVQAVWAEISEAEQGAAAVQDRGIVGPWASGVIQMIGGGIELWQQWFQSR